MLGVGRFGGIAGSFLVAELTARHLSFSQIFTVVAIPGFIAMAALIVKQWASPQGGAELQSQPQAAGVGISASH